MKKLVLFGAGKIGQSFIGQLFGTSGFEVVLVDISEPVINELNPAEDTEIIGLILNSGRCSMSNSHLNL